MQGQRIQFITRDLYQSGKVSFGEAVAISRAVRSWEPTEEDIKQFGNVLKQGLESLRSEGAGE